MNSVNVDGLFMTGLVKVIILIALLQLIKKLPDLINKIFDQIQKFGFKNFKQTKHKIKEYYEN